MISTNRESIKRKAVLGLFLAVILVGGCLAGDGDEEITVIGSELNLQYLSGQNLVEFHAWAGGQSNSLCIVCHGDKSAEMAACDQFDAPHKIHAEATRLGCTNCHQRVDPLQESGGQLRHQVATQTCAQCHGGQGPGATLFLAGN